MPGIRTVLAVVLLAALSEQAGAQYGGGGMRRGGMGDGDRARPDGSAMRRDEAPFMGPNDLVRMQLNNVRSVLKLTPEQAAAWQVYEDKVVNLLDDLSRGAGQPQGGNALKQIDWRVNVVRNRLTAMEDIAEAANKLDASLSEEQKTVTDRTLAGTMPALYSGAGAPGRPDFRRGDGERMRPPRQ